MIHENGGNPTDVERIAICSTDLDRARDLMRQFELVGDVQWPTRQPAVDAPFSFQVIRPGHATDIQAEHATGRAISTETPNAWRVLHTLHTFSGVRSNDQRNVRDGPLTPVWVRSMDAFALGLILMVLSSYIMWYQLPSTRRWASWLLLGVVSCGVRPSTFATMAGADKGHCPDLRMSRPACHHPQGR